MAEDIKALIVAELETTKAAILKTADDNAKSEAAKMLDLAEKKIAEVKGLPSDVSPESLSKLATDFKAMVDDWADMERLVKEGRFAANGTEGKQFHEAFSIAAKENADKLANLKKGETLRLDLKDMTFGNAFTTAGASVTYVRPGIIELPKRKLHIRELLPGGGMGNKSTFDFVKEITGSGSPIAPTAEGALKPQFGLALTETSVRAQWIAGFMKMSVNLLDDVEGMTTFLQSRLPEKLLRVEDEQILDGNGVGSNLLGLQSVGNFTAGAAAVTNRAETLVNAISQLENLNREANGILLNPADWYTLWLYKGSTSGDYTLPVNLVERIGGQMFIAGVPVFRSTAERALDYLVGDWTMGANLITREPARVEFFREDGTNVQTNQITVRIEERIALPVYGNDYFIYGSFDAVS
jgi:HK97 family phage major capsid protein